MQIKVNRLLSLILCLIIPIIILVEFLSYNFTVWWFPEGPWKEALLQWIAPAVFTLSWIYMEVIFLKRVANSMDIMDETSSVIPMRYRFFYGLNAIFILLVYLIPIITPIISAFAFMSLVFRLITINRDWTTNSTVHPSLKVITIIASFPSILISIMVVPELLELSNYLWTNYWEPLVEPLYNFSMSFATALTIGAFIILVRTGVSEYEQSYGPNEDQSFVRGVAVLEVIITGFLILLQYYQLAFIQVFNWIGFILSVFIWIVNTVKGRSKMQDFRSYFFGYLLTVLFLGTNLFFMGGSTSDYSFLGPLASFFQNTVLLRNIIVLISGIAYLGVFILIFFGHPDLEEE
jgi:hypothetical protein